jgi:hypothetical protein
MDFGYERFAAEDSLRQSQRSVTLVVHTGQEPEDTPLEGLVGMTIVIILTGVMFDQPIDLMTGSHGRVLKRPVRRAKPHHAFDALFDHVDCNVGRAHDPPMGIDSRHGQVGEGALIHQAN